MIATRFPVRVCKLWSWIQGKQSTVKFNFMNGFPALSPEIQIFDLFSYACDACDLCVVFSYEDQKRKDSAFEALRLLTMNLPFCFIKLEPENMLELARSRMLEKDGPKTLL